MEANTDKCIIPKVNNNYIPWGNYQDVEAIVKSEEFVPIWIFGPPGNGKSEMVEQVCAKLGRKCVRINFTNETDEYDLIGSTSISNDSTYFEYGPVIYALKEGAVLLLDEISAAHPNKILCLQMILEGKGAFIKKTGEYIKPEKGFQIFATCNTQGMGDETGRYIGTSNLHSALLDRFNGTMIQEYPDSFTEVDILANYFTDYLWLNKGININDIPRNDKKYAMEFIEMLVKWANQIRDSFEKDPTAAEVSEIITTRALIGIIKLYATIGDRYKAIKLSCNRFPELKRNNMLQLFRAIDKDFPDEFNQDFPDSNGN